MDVASPCNGTCTLNAAGVCLGCGRTGEEIAAWPGADAAQRLAIRRAARARLALDAPRDAP
jgi:predicted Fe-S protein YdhL (DUF1289 family)